MPSNSIKMCTLDKLCCLQIFTKDTCCNRCIMCITGIWCCLCLLQMFGLDFTYCDPDVADHELCDWRSFHPGVLILDQDNMSKRQKHCLRSHSAGKSTNEATKWRILFNTGIHCGALKGALWPRMSEGTEFPLHLPNFSFQ